MNIITRGPLSGRNKTLRLERLPHPVIGGICICSLSMGKCTVSCSHIKDEVSNLDFSLKGYFNILKWLLIWLAVMFVFGLIVFAASFYTMHDDVNPANPVCRADYSSYYMCPLCDRDCPFWYLKTATINSDLCTRRYRLISDNPIVWGFAIIMISSAFFINCLIICKAIKSSKGESTDKAASDGDQKKIKICPSCGRSLECPDNCSIVGQYIWMVVFIIITLVAHILLVMLSLLIEKQVRNDIVNRHNNSEIWILFLATFPAAIIQVIANGIIKRSYSIGLRCFYCINTDKCCCCCVGCGSLMKEFLLLLIPNMFISYTPIFYRIIFFGNLVGDPSSGYKHFVSDLRFQHCPSYGCMDITIYVFTSISGSAIIPLLCIIKNCYCCCCPFTSCDSTCCDSTCCDSTCFDSTCCDSTCCDSTCCDSTSRDSNCCCKLLGKNHIIEKYIEILIIYGHVLFFIAVTIGWVPLATATIAILIIGYYQVRDSTKDPKEKYTYSSVKGLKYTFLVFTMISTFSNIAIVIASSRFIRHIAYSDNIGHKGKFLLNFNGYLDQVLPEHKLTTLVRSQIFPSLEAQNLLMLSLNSQKVRNSNGQPILYLPYVDFQCLNKFYSVGNSFTADQYRSFISSHPDNNRIVNLKRNEVLECFNTTVSCRSRGYLSHTEQENNLSRIRGLFAISFLIPIITLVVVIISIIKVYRCDHHTSYAPASSR